METIKKALGFCVYAVIALVLNLCSIPVSIVHLIGKIRKGEVTKYTNVTYNGRTLSVLEMTRRFAIKLEPMRLDSDQGSIMMIHGQASNLFPFVGKDGVYTNESMSDLVEEGTYHLISCHNGFHKDFTHNGKTFHRDPNTISMFPSISVVVPFTGTMYVYADEFCLLMQVAQNPILWGKYEFCKQNLLETWKLKDKEMSFDELPDSIKKIFEKNAA